MSATHLKVDNLISTIDWNGQQIDGPTSKVMNLGDLHIKFAAFGWVVIEMNGNDMDDVVATLDKAKSLTGNGQPVCILMKTEMGKGVDFMEGSHEWHGIALTTINWPRPLRSCLKPLVIKKTKLSKNKQPRRLLFVFF